MTIPMPTLPVADKVTRNGLMMIWEMEEGMVLERRQLLETNLTSAYALIQGQCSDAVLEKVTDFVAVQQARDPIELLRLVVRSVMFLLSSDQHLYGKLVQELAND